MSQARVSPAYELGWGVWVGGAGDVLTFMVCMLRARGVNDVLLFE